MVYADTTESDAIEDLKEIKQQKWEIKTHQQSHQRKQRKRIKKPMLIIQEMTY